MKHLFKILFSAVLALAFAATSFCADIQKVERFVNGKLLPQYHGINATGSLSWNNSTGALTYSAESGRLRAITYYTANATYAKPAWLKFVIVKGVGGGGGGGGCAATSSSQTAIAGGGSGGGYFEKIIQAADLAVSEIVTVGAGGTAASAGANNGGTGQTTSFGSHCSGTGSTGGAGGPAAATTIASTQSGGAPGSGIGGDINIEGRSAPLAASYLGARIVGGQGTGSFLAGDVVQPVNSAGTSGKLYGGGGSGAYNHSSQGSARAGSAGAPGIVIVEEYE